MDPKVVVAALVTEFGVSGQKPNAQEREIISHIKSLLYSDMEMVQEIRTLGFGEEHGDNWDQDMDTSDEETDAEEGQLSLQQSQASQKIQASTLGSSASEWFPPPEMKPKFQERIPDKMTPEKWQEYKHRAYTFWTMNPKTGCARAERAKGSNVMNQFKKIKNMNVLYNFEQTLHKPTMCELNRAVLEQFEAKQAEGAVIHDRTLRIWAMEVRKKLDPHKMLKFKASPSWVYRFKKRNNIVDRAITHRVSRNWKEKEENLTQLADDFVKQTRNLLITENFMATHVFNADQSRFDKELHGHRTLRSKGTPIVKSVAGSMSATTHSYMIMPVISMDGEILRPMYILVCETTGRHPGSKPPILKT